MVPGLIRVFQEQSCFSSAGSLQGFVEFLNCQHHPASFTEANSVCNNYNPIDWADGTYPRLHRHNGVRTEMKGAIQLDKSSNELSVFNRERNLNNN